MDLTLLAAYWVVIALLASVPGADWAYLISAGLRRRGNQAVLGMVVGHLIIAVATALGLAALVATHQWISIVIGVCGGLVLLKLGTSALHGVLEERRGRTAAEVVAASVEDDDPQPDGSGAGGVALRLRTSVQPSMAEAVAEVARVRLLMRQVSR